jgi:hypothetical protein
VGFLFLGMQEAEVAVTSSIEFEDQLSDTEVELLQQVVKAVQSLRFGSVTITVHDGHIVEFQRNEKFRIRNDKSR